jgi:hypothetical protein
VDAGWGGRKLGVGPGWMRECSASGLLALAVRVALTRLFQRHGRRRPAIHVFAALLASRIGKVVPAVNKGNGTAEHADARRWTRGGQR